MIDIGDIRVAFVITVSLYYLTVYVRALELLYIRVYDSELSCFEVQRSVPSTSGREPGSHQPETYSRVFKCVRSRWFAIEETEGALVDELKVENQRQTHTDIHIDTYIHTEHTERLFDQQATCLPFKQRPHISL